MSFCSHSSDSKYMFFLHICQSLGQKHRSLILATFVRLIIHIFWLVFLVGTVFFSYNKSAGTIFRLVFSAKRTEALPARIHPDPDLQMPCALAAVSESQYVARTRGPMVLYSVQSSIQCSKTKNQNLNKLTESMQCCQMAATKCSSLIDSYQYYHFN